jgi:hypothetical protein
MIYRFSPLLGYSIELVMKPKLEFPLRIIKKPLKACCIISKVLQLFTGREDKATVLCTSE